MAKGERGSTLVASIIMLTLVAFMGSSVLEMTDGGNATATNNLQTIQALQVGNGGLEYSLARLNQGLSPDTNDKVFAEGFFTVATTPATKLVQVDSAVGIARKRQRVEANFSQHCVEMDVTNATLKNFDLKGIELIKTCNDRAIIAEVVVEWNWSVCAKNLPCDPATAEAVCHIPQNNQNNAHTILVQGGNLPGHLNHGDTQGYCPGDPPNVEAMLVCEGFDPEISACGADDGGATVRTIQVDNTLLANNISAATGSIIDVTNFNMDENDTYEKDQIGFSQKPPEETWYAVTVRFADRSSIRKPFKFSPGVESGGGH